MQRLQAARNSVAIADALSNAGRGAAMGYIADMPITRRAHVRPATTWSADSERNLLGQMLRSGPTPPPPQPRIPAGQPGAGRWMAPGP